MTVINGHTVEPHAVIEVEIGWHLVYGGIVRQVMDKDVVPKLPWEDERRVRLLLTGAGWTNGDEGQTVYKLIDDPK